MMSINLNHVSILNIKSADVAVFLVELASMGQ